MTMLPIPPNEHDTPKSQSSNEKDLLFVIWKKRRAITSIEQIARHILASDGLYIKDDIIKIVEICQQALRPLEDINQDDAEQVIHFNSICKTLLAIAPDLTESELMVCIASAPGKRVKTLANELCVDVRTVQKHREHIRRKLHLSRNENLNEFIVKLIDGSNFSK